MGLLAILVANRTLAEILAGLVLVAGLVGGFAWHERGRGALKCEQHDQAAVTHQIERNAQLNVSDAEALHHEIDAYSAALLVPVAAPTVRLCYYRTAGTVSPAGAAPTGSDAGPAIPAGNQGNFRAGGDVGEPLIRVGQRADARVAMLIDYIQRVCTVAP